MPHFFPVKLIAGYFSSLETAEEIALLKAGDAASFEKLIHTYGGQVYNTCLGLIQHPHDAEDTTQEVFIAVFRSVHAFRGESKLSTWLYRIAVTKSLEFLRARQRKKKFSFFYQFFGEEQAVEKIASPFYHPGVELENKERSAIVFKAIDRLPQNQKSAFILHKLEDLSYAEIADVLNVSVSAVESLMVRARQNLKKILSDYYENNKH